MKRFGLLMLVLVVLASPAFGRDPVGDVSAYADAAGTDCNITDNGGGGLLTIYVVHKFRPGESANGLRFKMDSPAGATWNYLSFSSTFTTVGQANSDISVGYGVCQSTTTTTGSALYLSIVASPSCGYVNFVPGFTPVIATACDFGEHPLDHGQGIVNPTGACQCNVATQPTSWGKVKALYH
jgi:hypothetical protein